MRRDIEPNDRVAKTTQDNARHKRGLGTVIAINVHASSTAVVVWDSTGMKTAEYVGDLFLIEPDDDEENSA